MRRSTRKQKAVCSLTERGIELPPVLIQLGTRGRRYLPTTPEPAIRQPLLEERGLGMWGLFMANSRSIHLGTSLPDGHRSVLDMLRESFGRVGASNQPSETRHGG